MMQLLLTSLAVVWTVTLLGAGVLAWRFYRRERPGRGGSRDEAGGRVTTPSLHSVAGRRGRGERKIVV